MSATGQTRPPVRSSTRSGTPRFELVVLVASLGGLDAVSTVLAGLPKDFDTPILVVQHGRAGGDPRRLAMVLHQRTRLPIRTAETGLSVHAPGVTVVPTGSTASLDDQHAFVLADAGPFGAGDDVLAHVAEALGPAAIGVELTGLLRDGAQGMQAVKRHGGRVLAQDPTSARAGSMPAAAIATDCVDFVLPLDRIPAALIALTMAPGAADLLAVPAPQGAIPHRDAPEKAVSSRLGLPGHA